MNTPPPASQPVRTSAPRQLTEKSKVILPDNEYYDDPDHKPKTDPESRG